MISSLAEAVPAEELRGIYRAFATDLARLSAELSRHVAAGEAEDARRAAHALAGAASGVGAFGLEAVCRRMMHPDAPPIGAAEADAIAAEAAAAVAALNVLAAPDAGGAA